MFFTMQLHHEVLLDPEYFGQHLKPEIRRKLREEVEGTVTGKHGIVIAVMDTTDDQEMGRGIIEYETGKASFMVSFKAIVFRPFTHEVIDAVVTVVNEHGFFAQAGPPNFRAFVSRHHMQDDMHFEASADMWVSEDEEVEVKKGCIVRMRIMNLTINRGGIVRSSSFGDEKRPSSLMPLCRILSPRSPTATQESSKRPTTPDEPSQKLKTTAPLELVVLQVDSGLQLSDGTPDLVMDRWSTDLFGAPERLTDGRVAVARLKGMPSPCVLERASRLLT